LRSEAESSGRLHARGVVPFPLRTSRGRGVSQSPSGDALGGAAAWPLAVHAQQSAMPVIGFLDSRAADAMTSRLGAFRQGLKELGFAEGENVSVVYRWAGNRVDRLPELAAELVRRQATVIVTTGGPTTALAAKTATTSIPIVFLVGEDPVRLGLEGHQLRGCKILGKPPDWSRLS
jgi:ABC-type uncharacterized transport system substrate-binding protein